MMNQKEIFKKIGGIIAEITEQYQYLSENPEKLNELELELFSANSDFLAEHVKVLKKLNENEAGKNVVQSETPPSTSNTTPPASEIKEPLVENIEIEHYVEDIATEILGIEPVKPAPVQKDQEAEPVVQEPVASAPVSPIDKTPEAEAVPKTTAADAPVVPESLNNLNEVIDERPVVNEVVIPEKITRIVVEEPEAAVVPPAPAVPSVTPPSAPPISAPAPTLNEIISAQREQQKQSSNANFSAQPVRDLKSVISLNDKLLFIKDLFNGYSLAYSEAIELVNRFDSFQAADSFLKTNYAAKNNWVSKPATVEKFYELLNRRFAK